MPMCAPFWSPPPADPPAWRRGCAARSTPRRPRRNTRWKGNRRTIAMTFQQPRSRRDLLRLGCRALSAAGAATAFGKAGLMTARAQTASDYKALVCIFLFGGNDANNLLVPNDTATYANYAKVRANLALSQGSLVSIHDAASNANYGLHPSFASIAPLFTTVNGGALYGTFPTQTLGGPDDSGSRGTWVPGTSEDQYMGALAKWFGLAQADMDYVFPNLKNFQYKTPAFI